MTHKAVSDRQAFEQEVPSISNGPKGCDMRTEASLSNLLSIHLKASGQAHTVNET